MARMIHAPFHHRAMHPLCVGTCLLVAAGILAAPFLTQGEDREAQARRLFGAELLALHAQFGELARAMALARAECAAHGYDSVGGCAQSEEDYEEDQKAIALARAAVRKRDELQQACRRHYTKVQCFQQLHEALLIRS